jgi:hypothetical protein
MVLAIIQGGGKRATFAPAERLENEQPDAKIVRGPVRASPSLAPALGPSIDQWVANVMT